MTGPTNVLLCAPLGDAFCPGCGASLQPTAPRERDRQYLPLTVDGQPLPPALSEASGPGVPPDVEPDPYTEPAEYVPPVPLAYGPVRESWWSTIPDRWRNLLNRLQRRGGG
jgi:hypothetical protein